jgi:hypothetical protein
MQAPNEGALGAYDGVIKDCNARIESAIHAINGVKSLGPWNIVIANGLVAMTNAMLMSATIVARQVGDVRDEISELMLIREQIGELRKDLNRHR